MPNSSLISISPTPAQGAACPLNHKKPHVRRLQPDRSQWIRLTLQGLFILLNIFLCAQFYLFVRYFELGLSGPHVPRPAGVDGWLPIAGFMNVRYLFVTRHIPAIHPAAMVLFLIFVCSSLLLKRAFCSWLCPVGTLSEYLWKLGRRLMGRNLAPPAWLDIALRSVKYLLLAFFVFIIGSMSGPALEDFMSQPYGILADVKMLHFFLHMSQASLVTIAVLSLLSVLIKNFWCRYACPYGALMSLVSLASPTTIRRDSGACIDCGKCSKACPQRIPVDRLMRVRTGECTACMECVASCSTEGALHFGLPPRQGLTPADRWHARAILPAGLAVALALIFFGGVLTAKATHHWQTVIPDDTYRELIPHVDGEGHPGF
jgi:polyferredoxin